MFSEKNNFPEYPMRGEVRPSYEIFLNRFFSYEPCQIIVQNILVSRNQIQHDAKSKNLTYGKQKLC
ncbi:hypothetical protein CFter6_4105 [Collimonas fungivorans]|uniref:Uncharacterized protein n=1 Tax=Collimonas fungivorans TaxID=158899 RepID=A0A127PH23_9BURK|nr:hypothetical protein CFter6_4105 [Collimonas fungivorans]